MEKNILEPVSLYKKVTLEIQILALIWSNLKKKRKKKIGSLFYGGKLF